VSCASHQPLALACAVLCAGRLLPVQGCQSLLRALRCASQHASSNRGGLSGWRLCGKWQRLFVDLVMAAAAGALPLPCLLQPRREACMQPGGVQSACVVWGGGLQFQPPHRRCISRSPPASRTANSLCAVVSPSRLFCVFSQCVVWTCLSLSVSGSELPLVLSRALALETSETTAIPCWDAPGRLLCSAPIQSPTGPSRGYCVARRRSSRMRGAGWWPGRRGRLQLCISSPPAFDQLPDKACFPHGGQHCSYRGKSYVAWEDVDLQATLTQAPLHTPPEGCSSRLIRFRAT
jgi:hypothetical protein